MTRKVIVCSVETSKVKQINKVRERLIKGSRERYTCAVLVMGKGREGAVVEIEKCLALIPSKKRIFYIVQSKENTIHVHIDIED